jgi:hypothetical protein
MKDKRFFVGMLVLMLVFGFIFVGCDNGTTDNTSANPFVGTWVNDASGYTLEIDQNNWVLKNDGENYLKGKYAFNERNATLSVDYNWDDENHDWQKMPYKLEYSCSLSEDGKTLVKKDKEDTSTQEEYTKK